MRLRRGSRRPASSRISASCEKRPGTFGGPGSFAKSLPPTFHSGSSAPSPGNDLLKLRWKPEVRVVTVLGCLVRSTNHSLLDQTVVDGGGCFVGCRLNHQPSLPGLGFGRRLHAIERRSAPLDTHQLRPGAPRANGAFSQEIVIRRNRGWP